MGLLPTTSSSIFQSTFNVTELESRTLLSVTVTDVVNSLLSHTTALSFISCPSYFIGVKVTLYSFPVEASADATSVVSSATGAVSSSAVNASVAGVSVSTETSLPSLNSAAHTGTLEVASIATTSDILNVFFAMPFFVFLIFVMIIVPLWVVDRLILWKKIVLSRAI